MNEAKEMTVLRQHAVVTLHRNEEVHKVFLNPGAYLQAHLSTYTKDGCSVFSVQLCTEEEYINYRIDEVVESINDTNAERKRLRDQFHNREFDYETYLTALGVTNELEMSDYRRLYRLMNRLSRRDYTCTNEEAVQLYNMVF